MPQRFAFLLFLASWLSERAVPVALAALSWPLASVAARSAVGDEHPGIFLCTLLLGLAVAGAVWLAARCVNNIAEGL